MDLNAVQNAIATNISNGIVEGYVNKLKAVKRTMYGRASLALLKRKMVFSDLCFNYIAEEPPFSGKIILHFLLSPSCWVYVVRRLRKQHLRTLEL